MASEESTEPQPCMPCRGTGQVISSLGGTTTTVTCPWCDGGGMRLMGVDAQARWPANEPPPPPEPPAPKDGDPPPDAAA